MQIETRNVDSVLMVNMIGRLDSHTAGDVGDRMVEIVQGNGRNVVLNLQKLDYVSSAGLPPQKSRIMNGRYEDASSSGVSLQMVRQNGQTAGLSIPRTAAPRGFADVRRDKKPRTQTAHWSDGTEHAGLPRRMP
jgi:anti-anti-sigma factor